MERGTASRISGEALAKTSVAGVQLAPVSQRARVLGEPLVAGDGEAHGHQQPHLRGDGGASGAPSSCASMAVASANGFSVDAAWSSAR